MDISSLVCPEGIVPCLKVTSKKQVLQELSRYAGSLTGLHDRPIFDTLLERERLGTTGVGNGVAIPHGKMSSLTRLYGIFARLERPVDFESIDEQPVDLIFLLLAPEMAGADHLKALACVSRLLRDHPMCEKLRATASKDALYALLVDSEARAA